MSEPVTHLMTVETNTEEDVDPVILLPTAAWIYVGLHTQEDLAFMREAGALPENAPEFGPEDNLVTLGMNNVDRETALSVLKNLVEVMEEEAQE